ncbi:hypothetical protein [Clostridium sp.]|nr:hypothetical protein [Clostridium sp.]MBK5240466.1 hypothetical protein [Clostridium sp.]
MKKKQNKLSNGQLSSIGIKRMDNDEDIRENRANDLNIKNNDSRTKNNK